MPSVWLLIYFVIRTVLPSHTTSVTINGVSLQAEVADSAVEKQLGLMFRKKLDENKGMLFIFSNEGGQPIWMKNMKIPLDILWIDKDKKIVHIERNAPPCESSQCPIYTSKTPAKYVLEVNAGWAKKNNITTNCAL